MKIRDLVLILLLFTLTAAFTSYGQDNSKKVWDKSSPLQ
jgi:hypothetical protein